MAIIQITNKRERKGLTFTSKIRLERNLFLKVFEEFDGIVALSNGVFRRVQPPDKFKGWAKRLVTEGHGRVYDVLPIATNHHKPANSSIRAIKFFFFLRDFIFKVTFFEKLQY